MHPHKHRTNRN